MRNADVVDAVISAFPGAEVVEITKRRPTVTDHTKTDEPQSILAAARAQGCSHPIRLNGSTEVIDAKTGDIVHQWSSERDELHGTVYVPCKTRRASKCPSCAALYQGDAFKLIADGLRTDDVKENPALFVTFTAPSFGPVHTQGRNGLCRPRRDGEQCEHGQQLSCMRRHRDDDPLLGQAIVPCCFDYDTAAIWNAHAGKLWRATRIAIDRSLAAQLGMSVGRMKKERCKTQYVKIAEFQARGLVHFHVAIRADGIDAPPDLTTDDLAKAIETAHRFTNVADHNEQRITWGQQLDIKVIGTDIEREKLAGYFAKYATKGSDAKGLLNSRIKQEAQIDRLPINNHLARLVRAAWKLANQHEDLNSDRWAHQFGFGGHFLTKSRAWSTTFKALRQKRSDHNAEVQRQSWQALSPNARLVVESRWEYAGSGYRTAAEAHVAALRKTA